MLNRKWAVLSEKLQASGVTSETIEARVLARHYFAGRATMRETQEEIGLRTVYAYALRCCSQEPLVWVEAGCDQGLVQELLRHVDRG